MIECTEEPSSLHYVIVITRLLKAFNIPLSDYPYVSVSKYYNNRAFVSLGYVVVDGGWIKKHETEAKVIPSSFKVKFDTSHASMNNP